MPNFSLVANSTFQPFTYQELLAPVMDMSNYHQKIADEYDKLSSQADVLEAMGANDRDKGAYTRYKNYSDALRMEADNLAMNGLDSESRQRLSELRRRYNTDIVPLQNAWNKREQEVSDQMKARLANPSLMFTRDANTTSIDDYVVNPTGGYGVINGSNIATQMSNMAKNLAEQVRSGRRENVDPYTYRYIEQYGLDENIIRNWRNYPTLAAMYEQVMRSNGVTEDSLAGSLNADDIINRSTGYAEMGMWDAMGKTNTQFLDNKGAQAELDLWKHRQQKAMDGEGDPNQGTLVSPLFDLPMQGADFSNAKERKEAMEILGYKEKDGKLMFDGKATLDYDLDKEEVEAYNKQKMGRLHSLQEKRRSGKASEAELAEAASLERMLGRYGNFKSPVGASTSKAFSLYDERGRILSKEQFVKQAGKSKNAQKALEDYYNKVMNAEKTLGITSGTNYNHQQLSNYYNDLRANDAAQMLSVRPLNFEKADWNQTSKTFRVKKIKGYRNGQPIYDSKMTSLGELLEKKNSNNEDIPVAAFWSDEEGREGLILATTEDGKATRYFIDAGSMSETNIRNARGLFALAKQYTQLGNESDAKKATESAFRALTMGLTLHNKNYEQASVRQPTLVQQGMIGGN